MFFLNLCLVPGRTCKCQIYPELYFILFFFNLHHAEKFKLNSGLLAVLQHSKCQCRTSQKAEASISACFLLSDNIRVNWKRGCAESITPC